MVRIHNAFCCVFDSHTNYPYNALFYYLYSQIPPFPKGILSEQWVPPVNVCKFRCSVPALRLETKKKETRRYFTRHTCTCIYQVCHFETLQEQDCTGDLAEKLSFPTSLYCLLSPKLNWDLSFKIHAKKADNDLNLQLFDIELHSVQSYKTDCRMGTFSVTLDVMLRDLCSGTYFRELIYLVGLNLYSEELLLSLLLLQSWLQLLHRLLHRYNLRQIHMLYSRAATHFYSWSFCGYFLI